MITIMILIDDIDNDNDNQNYNNNDNDNIDANDTNSDKWLTRYVLYWNLICHNMKTYKSKW